MRKYFFFSLFLIPLLFSGSFAFAATLGLSPSSGSYKVGDIFTVNILLNTQGVNTDGADIRYLNYPKNILEVQDESSTTTGIQILAGNLYPNTQINNVDSANGKINFSQTYPGGNYNGSGTLASVRFKALLTGTANVSFDFTLGLTTDSNIASGGQDVLSSVTNGAYSITSVDTEPPVISNISATDMTSNSAKINWTTNESSTSKVKYGITPSVENQTTEETNLVTSHTVNLANLGSNTTYYYQVVSKDAAGNISESIIKTFITLGLADTAAPAKITNLAAKNITVTSAELSWSAPGDDGNTGTAFQYDIRYSTSSITEANWNLATPVTGEPTPKSSGTAEQYISVGLFPNTTYYFAVKTADEVPNWSELSNLLQTTTFSGTLAITLAANPNSGTAPLNDVDFTVNVSGTAKGNINYTFYCNRADSGTNITSVWTAKYDNISETTKTAVDICDYPLDGTYWAKAIVERGSVVVEARVQITITAHFTSPPPSSGGGGGGVGFILPSDTTPPAQPASFAAAASEGQIALTWKNPTDSDFVRVAVVRKEGSAPTSRTDGKVVYESNKEKYIDTGLDNNKVYYYAVYAYDTVPNYSKGMTVSAQPVAGKQSVEIPKEVPKEIVATYIFSKDLYLGMRDEEVKKLQEVLAQDKTIYPEGLITGFYGILTQKAVQGFQVKYGITAGYGKVDAKTRMKLNELYGKKVQTPAIDKEALIKQIKEQIRITQEKIAQLIAQLIELLKAQQK